MTKHSLSILVLLLFFSSGCSINQAQKKYEGESESDASVPLEKINLLDGFKIEIYADDVKNARSLSITPSGVLFVGTRGLGNVYAIVDSDGDFKADKQFLIDEGLNMPNGVAFRKGSLYVAEVDRILRYDNIEANLSSPPEPIVVTDRFPSKKHHGWKYIAFGPDDKLYVPVGAPCNICESKDEVFNTITRMNPDGSDFEIVHRGIRNTVGFTWHPSTKELWFTDNGRDWLGEDIPACELNVATKDGLHFGYPYCHQGDILDPKFGENKNCEDYIAPLQNLGPHTAPLGIEFLKGNQVPKALREKAVVMAEHGSWNRKEPIGYRLSMVTIDDKGKSAYSIFADGWLENGEAWGRPVDLEYLSDGSILVSDDFANVIYRISSSN